MTWASGDLFKVIQFALAGFISLETHSVHNSQMFWHQTKIREKSQMIKMNFLFAIQHYPKIPFRKEGRKMPRQQIPIHHLCIAIKAKPRCASTATAISDCT
jgi:hypothetical protein